MRMVPRLLPVLLITSDTSFLFQTSLFRFCFHHLFVGRETVYRLRRPRKILSPQMVLLYVFSDFETELPRQLRLRPGEKFSCSVSWTRDMCCFRIICNTKTHAFHSDSGTAFFRKKPMTDFLFFMTIVGSAVPTRCVPIGETPRKLPRNFSSTLTIWVAQGISFFNRTPQVLMFSSLLGFSVLVCLLSYECSQCSLSLLLSSRQNVFPAESV